VLVLATRNRVADIIGTGILIVASCIHRGVHQDVAFVIAGIVGALNIVIGVRRCAAQANAGKGVTTLFTIAID